MTDAKKPPAAPTAPAPTPLPEDAAKTRIEEAQKEIRALKQEIVNMNGKIMNLDPQVAQKLQTKNDELRGRRDALIKALFALHGDAVTGRSPEEEQIRSEVLRLAAVEYFKKANVDPQLWKSLES